MDILASLRDENAAEFWWLNNGVTILTTSATQIGKSLHLENIQIVNGLQTTETIFQYCRSADHTPSNRCLLVKVIVSTKPSHRDQIIRATNNQNVVDTSGLRATDKTQRDIEEYLDRHSWCYERRKNYYKNLGKPLIRFVTPLYLAAAFNAIVLKRPHEAANQKSRFMRNEESYRKIFPETTPIHCWLIITEVFKKTEHMLQVLEGKERYGNRFVARWRSLVAFIAVAKILGRFSYSDHAVAQLDLGLLTDDLLSAIWGIISRESAFVPGKHPERRAKFTIACCEAAAIELDIAHIQSIEDMPGYPMARFKQLDMAFMQEVIAAMPKKPWDNNTVHQLAATLMRPPRDVYKAIEYVNFDQLRKERRERALLSKQQRDRHAGSESSVTHAIP